MDKEPQEEIRIFNPKKLQKLNNPERMAIFPPEEIVSRIGLANPQVIVDIGAGTAFFSKPFSRLFPQATIYACDISDIMLDWMRDNVVSDYPKIIPLKMQDNSVPLSDGLADFVFMVNLHHELDDPLKTLTECRRLLKPGGILAVSDWKKEPMEWGPSMDYRLETEEVVKQLEGSGFTGIEKTMDYPKNFLVYGRTAE